MNNVPYQSWYRPFIPGNQKWARTVPRILSSGVSGAVAGKIPGKRSRNFTATARARGEITVGGPE